MALDGIQDALKHTVRNQKTQRSLTYEHLDRVFTGTDRECPIRQLCTAIVSRYLAGGGNVNKYESIVQKKPGFLDSFMEFQNEIRKMKQSTAPWKDKVSLSDDPRMRGRFNWLQKVEGRELWYGYPMCFFHKHDPYFRGGCRSVTNHVNSEAEHLKDI